MTPIAVAVLLAVQGAPVAERPTPESLTAPYIEAFNAQDATRLARLFAPDALLMPPEAPSARGRAAIEAAFRSRFRHVTGRLHVVPLGFEVHGDRATLIARYEIRPEQDGDAACGERPRESRCVVIYRRLGGEWLIAVLMMNHDAPQTGDAGS